MSRQEPALFPQKPETAPQSRKIFHKALVHCRAPQFGVEGVEGGAPGFQPFSACPGCLLQFRQRRFPRGDVPAQGKERRILFAQAEIAVPGPL